MVTGAMWFTRAGGLCSVGLCEIGQEDSGRWDRRTEDTGVIEQKDSGQIGWSEGAARPFCLDLTVWRGKLQVVQYKTHKFVFEIYGSKHPALEVELGGVTKAIVGSLKLNSSIAQCKGKHIQ